jgi:hypothetical protein
MKRRRVNVAEIRRAYRAEPVVPFVLHLADGRQIPVRERFSMAFPPRSRTLGVYDTDDACSFIDVRLVTDLVLKEGGPQAPQGRTGPATSLRGKPTKRRPLNIEEIRNAYRAEPFVPFVLHLADGRKIPVRERFFMMFPPGTRTITVAVSDDAFDFIDARLVTDLKFKSPAKRRRRTA